MFFSPSLLSKKSPLGTVWCAAHLQHKLKKTQYVKTDVSSTVDKIMHPEVPIALRLSGNLLLGVVRIYSKKVDYLYEDCEVIRITINRVFTSANVNLLDDATHASVQSITLPENFELDDFELGDHDKDWLEDSHTKNQEDITFTEQIPIGRDPFIVFSFDEVPPVEDHLGSGPMPMEEDVPLAEVDMAADFSTSPGKQLGADDRDFGNKSPEGIQNIEVRRDAGHGFGIYSSPILPDRDEPDKFLQEQINKDSANHTAARELVLPDDGSVSPHQNQEKQSPFRAMDSPVVDGGNNNQSPVSSFAVDQLCEMEIQPSPLASPARVSMKQKPTVPAPKARVSRKRKQFFDDTIILSNVDIERGLDNASDILRARRNCSISSLSIWKQNKRSTMKDDFSSQPFMTGYCIDLQDIYKEDSLPAKSNLVIAEELEPQETLVCQPSLSKHDVEIELPRNNNHATPEVYRPPSPLISTPENTNADFQSERLETTGGDVDLQTTDKWQWSGGLDSGMATSDAFGERSLQGEQTVLSDINEHWDSAGELEFLEQESNFSPELPHELSSRTRAVVQYLKKQCEATPIKSNLEEPSEDLSLNKILQGKSRKICARMLFETLVLNQCELVKVEQEKPYGDIIVKLSKNSMGQFSS